MDNSRPEKKPSASTTHPLRSGYCLVGPTAVGKTDVAHVLARRRGASLLSADAMLVYRGMDVGTAKPTSEERAAFHYQGVDLVTPDCDFSVGAYCRCVQDVATDLWLPSHDVIIAGGTGLYVKAILQGLTVPVGSNPELRAEAQKILETKGLSGLQAFVKGEAEGSYERVKDKANPRRLIRALERAKAEGGEPDVWADEPLPIVVGLRMERSALCQRIADRVDTMYACGLLDEVQTLESEYGHLSESATQAIGYAEAFEVLHGLCTLEEAKLRTTQRTRRLAKRQMTWFRHQLDVKWVDVIPEADAEDAAEQVEQLWSKYGPNVTSI